MAMFNKTDEYGWMALSLHWLLFLLLAGLLISGKYSDSLSPLEKSDLIIGAHKQVGMAVFVLMAFRLLWRLINRTVRSSESWIARFLSFFMHWLMYLTVLAQAAVGVAMAQLAGRDVLFFNLFKVPSLEGLGANFLAVLPDFISLAGNSEAAHMRSVHELVGTFLIVLIVVHVAVALIHHFLMGDDVLRRMSFGYRPSYADKKSTVARKSKR